MAVGLIRPSLIRVLHLFALSLTMGMGKFIGLTPQYGMFSMFKKAQHCVHKLSRYWGCWRQESLAQCNFVE